MDGESGDSGGKKKEKRKENTPKAQSIRKNKVRNVKLGSRETIWVPRVQAIATDRRDDLWGCLGKGSTCMGGYRKREGGREGGTRVRKEE